MEKIVVIDRDIRIVGKRIGEIMSEGMGRFAFQYDNGRFSISVTGLSLTGPKIMDYLKGALGLTPSTLSTLADEVGNSICDTKTKEAFKRFTNLLIEKVEKK